MSIRSTHPHQDGKEKRKKKERNRTKKTLSRRNRETQNIMMMRKMSQRKRFREYVSWHILSRYPSSSKRTSLYMIAKKMMAPAYINMFRTRRNRRRIGKRAGSLIIAKNRERTWDRKMEQAKESAKPESLLECCYTWRSLVLCSAQHQKQKTRKMQRKVRAQLLHNGPHIG